METILGLILLLIVLVGGCCLFFLIFIQPIWGVVDVAVSKEHSGGTKAVVILLTLLLLGPIMTFFYACIGSRSRILRRCTLAAFVVALLAGVAALGLAIAVPMARQKLPWRMASADKAAARPTRNPVEIEANGVDPETVPSFTAVHLARSGAGQWRAAIAEFDGRGPGPQSALPVVLPGIYPLTHVAVDPKGPVYYGITTHEVGRIVPNTGHFIELKSDPGVSKPSWPCAIAYDSKQERLLIAARSQGYSYSPRTGEWLPLSWLKDDGMVALAHDPEHDLLHGLQTESGGTAATTLLQFNSKGALLAKTRLSNPIPVGRYPFALAQLAWAEDRLVCVVFPSEADLEAGAAPVCRTYLIDPRLGDCQPVRGGDAKVADSPAGKDLDPLRGSWGVVKATMNGEETRDASLMQGNWTFDGNELHLQSPQKGKARFAIKLDAKAAPKAFQLIPVEPANEASGWMLYSREGANLKIAFYDNLQGRPESFEPRDPKAEPELIVVTLSPKE